MAQIAQRGCAVSFLRFLILDWKKPWAAQLVSVLTLLWEGGWTGDLLRSLPGSTGILSKPEKGSIYEKHSILNLVSITAATKAHILLPQLHNTSQTHILMGNNLFRNNLSFLFLWLWWHRSCHITQLSVNLLGYTWIHPQSLGSETHLIKDKLQRTSSRNIAIWAMSLATGGSAGTGGWTRWHLQVSSNLSLSVIIFCDYIIWKHQYNFNSLACQ